MKYLFAIALSIVILSCKKETIQPIVQFENPASRLGSEPSLHLAKDGTIYLSWIEEVEGKNSKLFFSTLNEANLGWSESILIAEGADWFVNWADFPSISSFGENSLAAHYLDKSAEGTYTYDVKLITSNNNGNTWDEAIIPHKDNTTTEHGFVSKTDLGNGELLSVWLDGRKYAYSKKDSTITKEMTLRSATINEAGTISAEIELDGRVCDCCQTDIAMTKNGPIVVYRNRSEKEIRDIYFVRMVDGTWTQPKPIHNDNWLISGCPVNGPAISANKNNVAVAWFTSANEIPKVNVTFSQNHGDAFGKPLIVDQIKPSGRVDIESLKDGSAMVSWLDSIEDKAVIQLQRIYPDGKKSQVMTISESSERRSSGFPRMTVKDDYAYLAWTDSGDTLTVKTAKVNISAIAMK